MTVAHNAMVAAVVAQLLQAPAVAGGNVERGRQRPVPETATQFVTVSFGASLPRRGAIFGAPVDWETVVQLRCYARGSGALSGEQAALDLYAAAYARLFGDATLGGLVQDMEPLSVETDDDAADTPLGCAISAVRIFHRTAANTLEV